MTRVGENVRQSGNVRYDECVVLSVEATPAKHVGPQPLGDDDVAMNYGASVVRDVVHVVGLPPLLRVSVPDFAQPRCGRSCRQGRDEVLRFFHEELHEQFFG